MVLYVWNMADGSLCLEYGGWFFMFGIWQMVLYVWNMADGSLCLEYGRWFFMFGIWRMVLYVWNMADDSLCNVSFRMKLTLHLVLQNCMCWEIL